MGLHDLSDCEETKEGTKSTRNRHPHRQTPASLTRQIEKISVEALQNTETITDFKFNKPPRRNPRRAFKTIDHDLPWTLVSADEVNLVHYLPKIIGTKAQVSARMYTTPKS
jgi:hypothetical protein